MTRARDIADLVDANGDVKTGNLDNVQADVVDDTTLQLGGNLDVNGNAIVSTSNGDVTINPNGTGDIVLDANVGIGTDSPAYNLSVESTSGTSIGIKAGTSSTARIRFGDSDDDDIGQVMYDNGGNSMRFHTNASERMRIDSSGNVGVGTSGPTKKLTVFGSGAGNATVQIEGESGADPYINFLANNTQHWSIGIDDSDSDKFKISKHSALGTNDYFNVDTSGKVGIGTSTTDGALTIYNSSVPRIAMGYSSTQDHYIAWDSAKVHIQVDPGNANASSDFKVSIDGNERLNLQPNGQLKLRAEGGSGMNIDARQGSAKVWAQVDTLGTFIVRDTYNVSSATDGGVGRVTVNVNNDFNNAYYAPAGASADLSGGSSDGFTHIYINSAGQYTQRLYRASWFDANFNGSSAHGDLA